MGRQQKEIDWDLVDRMLHAGSDGAEIAGALGVYPDTLYRHIKRKHGKSFAAFAADKHCTGIGKIRLAQYEKAIGVTKKGDTQLLLFLGRVRLKQIEAQQDKEIVKPPNEELLELQDQLIKVKYENHQLRNAIQSQTAPILQRSDSSV